MKKTELKDVYCVPKTKDDFDLLKPYIDSFIVGNGFVAAYWDDYFDAYAVDVNSDEIKFLDEIPVSKFVDLLEDRIVGWRLEEIGFVSRYGDDDSHWWHRLTFGRIEIEWSENVIWIAIDDVASRTSIKTFTELETLIRFLR